LQVWKTFGAFAETRTGKAAKDALGLQHNSRYFLW
jgi:hypothetical protein